VADIPAILPPGDYARWLGEEPDPRDLINLSLEFVGMESSTLHML
jgi:hypothetical protein